MSYIPPVSLCLPNGSGQIGVDRGGLQAVAHGLSPTLTLRAPLVSFRLDWITHP